MPRRSGIWISNSSMEPAKIDATLSLGGRAVVYGGFSTVWLRDSGETGKTPSHYRTTSGKTHCGRERCRRPLRTFRVCPPGMIYPPGMICCARDAYPSPLRAPTGYFGVQAGTMSRGTMSRKPTGPLVPRSGIDMASTRSAQWLIGDAGSARHTLAERERML
jgi:hypothetical protein